MRRPVTYLSILGALGLLLGCAAQGSGGGGGRRSDAGGTGFDAGNGGGGGGGTDGGGGHLYTDAGPITRPDSGFVGDAGCNVMTPLETTIVGDPPDMLIVMDISGSMCAPLGLSPQSKMHIMKGALTTLVDEKNARINFGLMTFPSDSECGAGTIRDPIAPRNASAIDGTLSGIHDDTFGCAFMNGGATPTAPSIDAARSYFGGIPVNPIGRYVLLATDGLPNCGPMQPDGSTGPTVDETVAAISTLESDGINTYVIGFGAALVGSPDALRRMATAGGTGTPFNANSADELSAALDAIAAAIIPPSCVVELGGPSRNPALFQVRFDGGPLIPRNMSHTSGWDYDSATNTITFYGSDCTQVESGSVTSIDVDFGCPGPLL